MLCCACATRWAPPVCCSRCARWCGVQAHTLQAMMFRHGMRLLCSPPHTLVTTLLHSAPHRLAARTCARACPAAELTWPERWQESVMVRFWSDLRTLHRCPRGRSGTCKFLHELFLSAQLSTCSLVRNLAHSGVCTSCWRKPAGRQAACHLRSA